MKLHPLSFGIAAAILFGMSVPLSKLLVDDLSPLMLSGILYLGGGLALLTYRTVKRSFGARQIPIRMDRKKRLSLLGTIFFGGILAPFIALIGLTTTPAATAALLMNFEAAATVLIAGILFKEYVGKRIAIIVSILTFGAIVLSFDPSERIFLSTGAMFILLSCFLWGMDNNVSRYLAYDDPTYFVMIKGLFGGTIVFAVSLILGYDLPSWGIVAASLALGALSYGISLAFFMFSLRDIGSARTGTIFALAPFAGVAFSLVIFQELPGWQFAASLPFMLAGLILLLRETQSRLRDHEEMKRRVK